MIARPRVVFPFAAVLALAAGAALWFFLLRGPGCDVPADVPDDPGARRYWCEVYEEHGAAEAYFGLGTHYLAERSDVVEYDGSTGAGMLEVAARRGHRYAQSYLGFFYLRAGLPERGVYWLTERAKAGDLRIIDRLARMHLDGVGVERDLAEGIKWIHVARALGDAEAADRYLAALPELYGATEADFRAGEAAARAWLAEHDPPRTRDDAEE